MLAPSWQPSEADLSLAYWDVSIWIQLHSLTPSLPQHICVPYATTTQNLSCSWYALLWRLLSTFANSHSQSGHTGKHLHDLQHAACPLFLTFLFPVFLFFSQLLGIPDTLGGKFSKICSSPARQMLASLHCWTASFLDPSLKPWFFSSSSPSLTFPRAAENHISGSHSVGCDPSGVE